MSIKTLSPLPPREGLRRPVAYVLDEPVNIQVLRAALCLIEEKIEDYIAVQGPSIADNEEFNAQLDKLLRAQANLEEAIAAAPHARPWIRADL